MAEHGSVNNRVHIFSDENELFERCAGRIVEIGTSAIAERGNFHFALAGGTTPQGLYRRLSEPRLASELDWTRCQIFFGDERAVPPDHRDSNYRMAREALLDHIVLPAENIHPISTEKELQEAARDYGHLLKTALPHDGGRMPVFDLILLGMGADGHVASLFPGTDILAKKNTPVAAVYVEKLEAWRISLTLPAINHARHVLILVSGEKKADIVRHVLGGMPETNPLPVQRIHPSGELEWYLDAAAAHYLHGTFEQ